MSTKYEKKFDKLIEAIESKGSDIILIAHPWVIGDTYEEITESLTRIYNAGKRLHIPPQSNDSN